MSDLQCAAGVLLTGHGTDAAGLAAAASERRVAAVYRCDGGAAASAASVAACLGLPLEVLPHATTSTELRAALQDLADLHRGESVVVLADPDAVTAVLAGMGGPSRVDDRGWTEVLIDSDGWALSGDHQG